MDPMDQTRRRLAAQRRVKAPQCPYCGEIVPPNTHGDVYFAWMGAHLDNRFHRIWWKVYKPFRKEKR